MKTEYFLHGRDVVLEGRQKDRTFREDGDERQGQHEGGMILQPPVPD